MLPGHPSGQWSSDFPADRRSPTPEEFESVFDEQDYTGTLSPASWYVLARAWYGEEQYERVASGVITCRPDISDFDPNDLVGQIPPERLEELTNGAEPSPAEITIWEEIKLADPHLAAELAWGLEAVWVMDARSRRRLLVTVHADQRAFERVAGLYHSLDEATADLLVYGWVEWA